MFRNTIFAALLALGLSACAAVPATTNTIPEPVAVCEITTTEEFMNTRLSQYPEIKVLLKIDSSHQISAAQRAIRTESGPEATLRDFDTIMVLGIPGQNILGMVFTLDECFQGEHVGPADAILRWLTGNGVLPTTQRS